MVGILSCEHLCSEKIEAVDQAFRETFGKVPVGNFKPMNRGLSSAYVYKFTVLGKLYFLKINTQIGSFIDIENPHKCMKIAAKAGIAPKVLFCSETDGIYITEYVKAEPLAENFNSFHDLLGVLASAIKGVHDLPPFPKTVNFFDGVDRLIQKFQQSNLLPDRATREHFNLYSEIRKTYRIIENDLVPSHNDLNPNNLLYDGDRLWIVDWDSAFLNDRYVDLAVIAKYFVLNEKHERLLLEAYFGDLMDEEKSSRFFLMQQVCYIYYAINILIYADTIRSNVSVPNNNMDTPRVKDIISMIRKGKPMINSYEVLIEYGKAFLNEALINMRLPRFEKALIRVA